MDETIKGISAVEANVKVKTPLIVIFCAIGSSRRIQLHQHFTAKLMQRPPPQRL
ncbi:hypothetical protein [Pseudovibrio denitrificans]|uniref:hypothetical protein n=1 Tax=Pseudovibrio denitrificans TaxID=258256 RepID=UPI000A7D429A|nr:hypothetical protein [Pseudovibrio denitrificans]